MRHQQSYLAGHRCATHTHTHTHAYECKYLGCAYVHSKSHCYQFQIVLCVYNTNAHAPHNLIGMHNAGPQIYIGVHESALNHSGTDVQMLTRAPFTSVGLYVCNHIQTPDTHTLSLSLVYLCVVVLACLPLCLGEGMRALQPAPSHSSAGLCHVAFAGDQV